jgi:hypothetical protein
LLKQYCTYDSFTDIYKWQFTYDSFGNRLRQVDPQLKQTDQEYDALGNLLTVKMPTVPVVMPGATTITEYRPFASYEYNSAGFKTGTVSANENAKGTKQQTNYTYD